jgi:hypothetical protein
MFDLKPNSRPARFTSDRFWDLMSFDTLMTRQVIHLIYWSGLGITALVGFGFIGTAVGVATAFRAPIGGVMFVLEEAVSYFESKLIFRSYLACVFSYYTYAVRFLFWLIDTHFCRLFTW